MLKVVISVLCIISCLENMVDGANGCPKWKSLNINADTILEGMRKGWYFPLMRKVPVNPSELFGTIPADSRSWKHQHTHQQRCGTVTAVSGAGNVLLAATLGYNNSMFYAGTVGNSGNVTGNVIKVSMFADLQVVWTYEKKYFLGAFRIFGREPFWTVTSQEQTMTAKARKEAIAFVKTIGFTGEVGYPKSPTLKPYKIVVHSCENGRNNTAPPGTGLGVRT